MSLPWWTDLHPQADRRVGRHDRLGHGRRDVSPNGRHNFPKLTPERKDPQGPSRFTTTVRPSIARAASSPTRITARRGAPSRRNLDVSCTAATSTTTIAARASFSNGTVSIQTYEPFSATMRSRFKHRRRQGALRSHRPDQRRRGLGRRRRGRSRALAGADLPASSRTSTSRRRRTSSSTAISFTASGQGGLPGNVPSVQGRPRAEGHVHQPAGRRERLAVPGPARLRALAARPARDHATRRAGCTAARRASTTGWRRSARKTCRRCATWDVAVSRRRSRAAHRLSRDAGAFGSPAAPPARNRLDWPLGKWALKHGDGEVDRRRRRPASQPMTRERCPRRALQAELTACRRGGPVQLAARRSATCRSPATLPTRSIPSGSRSVRAGSATPKTYVEFQGQTAYGQRSRIPFHVTSLDWQESDRVLAGIMTAFGAPTGADPIGGHGEFDGVMLEAFSRPRIEGTFSGDRMRAWDVVWGSGTRRRRRSRTATPTSRTRSSTPAASEITRGGQFSLGYPRKDGGEEINARVRLTRRPMADLRHAFELDDYRHGRPRLGRVPRLRQLRDAARLRPLLIEDGVAYGETFERRRRVAALRGHRRAARHDSRSRRAPARSPAPRGSAGTATIRSTPTAGASRSSR